MVKVNMPRAQWDAVLFILEETNKAQWNRPFIMALHKEIADQVYSQEY